MTKLTQNQGAVAKPLVTEPTNTESKVLEMMQAMQEQLAANNETIASLQKQVAASNDAARDPEIVDGERKPAGNILIATIDGMPITEMRLVKKTKVNDAGMTVVLGFDAVCKVHGKKEEVTITYGDMDNPTDYLNLPRTRFDLIDQIDHSGASKIEPKKLIRSDGLVDEKQEVNNQLVPTGRKVRLDIREDFRYYTIEVNGEKLTLPQNNIYR